MLVPSTLEYAASIWDPHLAKDCDLLEKLYSLTAICEVCLILAGVTLRPPAGS